MYQPIAASKPFQLLGLDCIGPLPPTPNGNRYILVCIDYLTRYVIAMALPDISAKSTALAFCNNVVYTFGCPQAILSNNASNFTSSLLEDVCSLLNIEHRFSTTYRPPTNGLVERANQSIIHILRAFIDSNFTTIMTHYYQVLYSVLIPLPF